jgi:hypothetical protein
MADGFDPKEFLQTGQTRGRVESALEEEGVLLDEQRALGGVPGGTVVIYSLGSDGGEYFGTIAVEYDGDEVDEVREYSSRTDALDGELPSNLKNGDNAAIRRGIGD